MRLNRSRATDGTFELNLAPFLDIIVSIIPMLLLSVAFVQIKMIEAPTPQVVSQDVPQPKLKPEPTITLRVSHKAGFEYEIVDGAKTNRLKIANLNNEFDYDGLAQKTLEIKKQYPDLFKLQLAPSGDVAFEDIVKIMDSVRQKQKKTTEAVSFTDAQSGKTVQTDYLFPDIVFASIGG